MTDYLYRPPYKASGQAEYDQFDVGLVAANAELTIAHDHVIHGEIQLTPKSSSTGPEGTMFYSNTDDHVYVATE